MGINTPILSVDETYEAQQKLKNIELYLPNANSVTLKLARFLGTRLEEEEIVPAGFMMMAELAIYDLTKGVNGFTGERINSSLVGLPPMTYYLMRESIPEIAKAVFSGEFAAGVQEMKDKAETATDE